MNAALKLPGVRGLLRHDEPLAARTSWRVGGSADTYFEPADRADLLDFIAALPAAEPVLWLGLGSNLLVRDGGYRGTVICLHGALDAIQLEVGESEAEAGGRGLGAGGTAADQPGFPSPQSPVPSPQPPVPSPQSTIYAEAGAHCARLAKFATAQRKKGLGFMAGIPGTVGGALAMNAGAWGGETWPVVSEAEVVLRDGSTHWLTPAAFVTGYRHVEAPEQVLGYLAARFAVSADTDGSYARSTKDSLAQRKATQPVGKPSAGSTFRNPPGDHAARLIESCGLKGHRIGGAYVSQLHANFLITEDGARAADVEALIAHIRSTVKQQAGVDLHPEVRVVGVAA